MDKIKTYNLRKRNVNLWGHNPLPGGDSGVHAVTANNFSRKKGTSEKRCMTSKAKII